MMRIVINPNDLSKPERAEERIADLEKQLAEQTKRAETAEQWHLNAIGWADEEKTRAEAAEKRVAELQALVDAATKAGV